MTRHEIATLACKILALWLFAHQVVAGSASLVALTFAILTQSQSAGAWFELVNLVPVMVSLVLALVLWTKSSFVASLIVGKDVTLLTAVGLDAKTLLAIACTTAGIWFLVPAMQELVLSIVEAMFVPVFSEPSKHPKWFGQLLSSIVGLILSSWLIFGSAGIVRILWLLRYPQVPQPHSKDVDHAD